MSNICVIVYNVNKCAIISAKFYIKVFFMNIHIHGFDPEKLKKQVERVLEENKQIVFIEEIISFLPCSKATFYKYFPHGSDFLNELNEKLDLNKVSKKAKLRGKWEDSDNATLNIALYKLLSNSKERNLLADRQEVKETSTRVVVKDQKDKEAIDALDDAGFGDEGDED